MSAPRGLSTRLMLNEDTKKMSVNIQKAKNLDDFQDLITCFSPTVLKIWWHTFNKIIHFTFQKKHCYMSQQSIANAVGCSRKHVNETLSKFTSMGILTKTYRHNDTCVYRLPKFLIFKDLNRYLHDRVQALFSYENELPGTGYTEVTQCSYDIPSISIDTNSIETRLSDQENQSQESDELKAWLASNECQETLKTIKKDKIIEMFPDNLKDLAMIDVARAASLLGNTTAGLDKAFFLRHKHTGIFDPFSYTNSICYKTRKKDEASLCKEGIKLKHKIYEKLGIRKR